jgi:hypothetical protein
MKQILIKIESFLPLLGLFAIALLPNLKQLTLTTTTSLQGRAETRLSTNDHGTLVIK